MYHQIRAFFFEKGVLEVETPIFSSAGNPDHTVHNLTANFGSSNHHPQWRYAHTSPEFPMKRLVAEDVGAIYQICKVFRVAEVGRWHNPEFSMLEWYRPNLSYTALMTEIEELLCALNIATQCQRISYSALFKRFLALDIMTASIDELASCAAHHQLDIVGKLEGHNAWCDLLITHLIEPELKKMGPVFIFDYPASQAALAQVRQDEQPMAERFELYIDGLEIASGYQELTDSIEYRRRFIAENKLRSHRGLDEIAIDENLLQAMSTNFPECSGVAMGLDRLLMISLKAASIQDVLSFDFDRA